LDSRSRRSWRPPLQPRPVYSRRSDRPKDGTKRTPRRFDPSLNLPPPAFPSAGNCCGNNLEQREPKRPGSREARVAELGHSSIRPRLVVSTSPSSPSHWATSYADESLVAPSGQTDKGRRRTPHCANSGHSPTAWRMGQRPKTSIIRIRLGLASCCLMASTRLRGKVGGPIGLTRDGDRLATLAGATPRQAPATMVGAADCQRKEAAAWRRSFAIL